MGLLLPNNQRSLFLLIQNKLVQNCQLHFTRRTMSDKASSTDLVEDYATVTYVTSNNEEMAMDLATRLVENNLAACVNILKSVESIYKWKGKVEHDSEALMIIKSHSSRTKELTEFVQKNHLYSCPEVVTLKAESVNEKYFNWIKESISPSGMSPSSSKGGDESSKEKK